MTRRKARKTILDCLYGEETGIGSDNLLDEYKSDAQFEFMEGFVKMVRANRDFCDGYISRYSRNWNISRIGEIDRIILSMGICELLIMKGERRIAINEAVELAKKYSTEKSASFVNGILDRVAKEGDAENHKQGSMKDV